MDARRRARCGNRLECRGAFASIIDVIILSARGQRRSIAQRNRKAHPGIGRARQGRRQLVAPIDVERGQAGSIVEVQRASGLGADEAGIDFLHHRAGFAEWARSAGGDIPQCQVR